MREWILFGEAHGVVGSICRSRERKERRLPRSCLVMSEVVGVGFLPKAREVKAFQSVFMAADCRERSSLCCEGGREGSGRLGGGWE